MKVRLLLLFLFFYNTLHYAQTLQLTLSTGHLGKVKDLAITNDAKLLATAGEDAAVKVWNIDDKRLLYSVYPHESGITALCFSQDNQYLATAGMDGKVKIIHLNSQEVVYEFDNVEGEVFKIKFVTEFLLFITKGGMIYRLDWQNKKLAPDGLEIKSDLGNFSSLNYSFKMKWLTVGKMEGDIVVWRGYDRPNVIKKGLHTDWISAIDYIPSDSLIVTASWDKTIKIWDINADTLVDQMTSPDNTPIVDLKYSSFFNVLVFATKAQKIYFYAFENGKINKEPLGVRHDFEKMVFTESTQYAAFSNKDGSISVWKLEVGNSQTNVRWRPVKGHLVDGEINLSTGAIAFVSTDGIFYSWEPNEHVVTRSWKVHNEFASALEYTLNGNKWITTGADSLVKIWSDHGKLLDTLRLEHKGMALTNIPIIGQVAIGTKGGDVLLWNSKKSTRRLLYQHNGEVVCVENDSDAQTIASIGRDRKLIVYSLEKQKIIFETTVADLWLNDLKFSEDGRQLVVSGKKGIYAWNCEDWSVIEHNIPSEDILEIDYFSKKQQWIFGKRAGDISIWNEQLNSKIEQFKDSSIPMVDIIPYIDQNIFFTIRTNTTFEIWNIEKKKKDGEIIVTDEGKWVIEHHSGLFDVGDLNMSELYYVYGTETIDFDQLKDKYWEPGLAYEILQGNPLRKVPPLSNLSLFPKTNTFEREGKLYIEVIDRGGGIGGVSLYINNKEVITDVLKEGQKEIYEGKEYYTILLDKVKIHLIPNQENDIMVLTSNKAGTLNGRGIKLKYKGKEIELEAPPTLYGVIVGVSDYRGRLLDLKYAAEDAKAMYEAIDVGSEKLFGVKNSVVQLLTTDAEEEVLQPTKENIKAAFESIQQRANSSDILFVFLAGHGAVAENKEGDNDFHFLTKDMSNSDLSDPDIKNNYTINGTELLDWIKEIPISKQVFVVDACHAGSFSTELITSRDYNEEGMKKRALERMRAKTGMFMLSGASSDKVSYESSYLEHGLLTYSLLDYLKRGELDEGRFVDVQDLFAHAVESVPQLASAMSGEQQPEYRVPVGAGSFYIAELPQAVRDSITLSIQKNLISAIYLEDAETWADHLRLSQQVKTYFVLKAEEKELTVRYQKNAKGPNTYIIRGKYEVHKNNILLKLHLISENQVIEKWTVKAKDIKDCQEQLFHKIEAYFNSSEK
ncbi:caspase family protein [Flammeovirga sp. EKP202]|uniref:caspase family protein n=1 Tax=Flammeovirga sp. EKP202 TaxID=2770592 RepID=UPI00165EDCC7|nr:caspase family protein [Flammeovirga sp. EKP202]MBD0404038.1 caspase family protein [Flammeovirga sp. EKP202]